MNHCEGPETRLWWVNSGSACRRSPDTVEVMADSSGLVLVLWCFYTRQKFNSRNFHLGNQAGSAESFVLFGVPPPGGVGTLS